MVISSFFKHFFREIEAKSQHSGPGASPAGTKGGDEYYLGCPIFSWRTFRDRIFSRDPSSRCRREMALVVPNDSCWTIKCLEDMHPNIKVEERIAQSKTLPLLLFYQLFWWVWSHFFVIFAHIVSAKRENISIFCFWRWWCAKIFRFFQSDFPWIQSMKKVWP